MGATRRSAMSAGGLVIRGVGGRPEIVIGRRRRERDGFVWSLPKGTPEEGETQEQTALREVREETGLEVQILRLNEAIARASGGPLNKDLQYQGESIPRGCRLWKEL